MNNVDKILLGRFGALESDTPELDVEEPTIESEVEAAADVNSEALAENEMTEANEETETLEEASESLESFLLTVQAAKNNGGLTPREAAILHVGMDNSLRRAGITANHATANSLESFDASTERERISQTESVENAIKDALVAVWEAIKRALRKAITFVRKWYLKIFDGASRLKRQAQALRKKADNTTGTIKEKKITTSTLSQLHIDKKMPESNVIAKDIEEIGKTIEKVTSDKLQSSYSNLVDNFDPEAMVSEIETLLSSSSPATEAADGKPTIDEKTIYAKEMKLRHFPKNTDKEFLAWLKAHREAVNNVPNTNKVSNSDLPEPYKGFMDDEEIKEYAEAVQSKVYAGNFRFVVVISKEGKKFEEMNISSIKKLTGHLCKVVVINASNKVLEVDESKEVPTLSSSDVSSICSAVESLCDVVIDYKKGFENYEKVDKKYLDKLEKVNNAKLTKYSENPQVGKVLRDTVRIYDNIHRNKNASINTVIGRGLSMARAALSYGSQSLSQYKDN